MEKSEVKEIAYKQGKYAVMDMLADLTVSHHIERVSITGHGKKQVCLVTTVSVAGKAVASGAIPIRDLKEVLDYME